MLGIDTKDSRIDDFSSLKKKLETIRRMQIPSFAEFRNDLDDIKAFCRGAQAFRNIIIIGNGGSISSSIAFYGSLGSQKIVHFITTSEPDYLERIALLCPPEDTVVIAISKSGSTITTIEALLFFEKHGYRMYTITQPSGTLYEVSRKMGYPTIEHPPIGGRYAARTTCALVPACLMGLDLDRLEGGFADIYARCQPEAGIDENPALRLASVLYLLEQQGKVDVFIPVYSASLAEFLPIMIQISHESFGKEQKGQTYFGGLAPETQHHTNQRFFGGRQNVCGLFISAQKQASTARIKIPQALSGIKIRGKDLSVIDGIPLEKALMYEYTGTYNDAVDKKIPVAQLWVDKVDEHSAGELMGFFQYFGVYSSILRDVDPFDQPQVESAKDISFRMRLEYRK